MGQAFLYYPGLLGHEINPSTLESLEFLAKGQNKPEESGPHIRDIADTIAHVEQCHCMLPACQIDQMIRFETARMCTCREPPQFAESPTRDILILEVTSSKEVMILEVPPESAFSFLGKYEAPATARPQNFFQAAEIAGNDARMASSNLTSANAWHWPPSHLQAAASAAGFRGAVSAVSAQPVAPAKRRWAIPGEPGGECKESP